MEFTFSNSSKGFRDFFQRLHLFVDFFVKLKNPESPTFGINVHSLCIHMALIRSSALLNYTSKRKTDCNYKFIDQQLKSKEVLSEMTALLKFLVLLAIVILEIYANSFQSPSQVARNQVQVNLLIKF
jgi:hypothetical protein